MMIFMSENVGNFRREFIENKIDMIIVNNFTFLLIVWNSVYDIFLKTVSFTQFGHKY